MGVGRICTLGFRRRIGRDGLWFLGRGVSVGIRPRLLPRRLLRLAMFLFGARGAVAGTPVLVRLVFTRGPVFAWRLASSVAGLLLLLRLLALGIRGGFIRGRSARWTIAAVPRLIHCALLPHARARMSRDEPRYVEGSPGNGCCWKNSQMRSVAENESTRGPEIMRGSGSTLPGQ